MHLKRPLHQVRIKDITFQPLPSQNLCNGEK